MINREVRTSSEGQAWVSSSHRSDCTYNNILLLPSSILLILNTILLYCFFIVLQSLLLPSGSLAIIVLFNYLNKFCITYFNNILIYFKIENKYIIYIKKVLEKLKQVRLLLKLEKYKFYKKELYFLRFIIEKYKI